MENQETQARKTRKMNPKPSKEKKEPTSKSKNPIWKWLFLILLAINVAGVLFVAVRVMMPRDQAVLTQKQTSTSDQKVAQITSTTEQLNELINSYLEPYQTDEMSYKFYISEQEAVLEASYQLFGTKIPLYIYFEPLALADGSVSLSVKSISAGNLSLPTSDILAMLKSYNLPNFVQVDSKNSQLIINLPKVKLASDLYLKANQIDLVKGNFVFDFMKKA
ncbi:YpmS family protein [Lactococcus taiwanensis]|uniref:YpmS family protein n=1 Tax=Lactococcus taiwanensis TaxID=1151742 RepID=UPI003D0B5B8E